MKYKNKTNITDLAIFGGEKCFSEIRSTSNLVQPDENKFFNYLKKSYESGFFTENGPLVEELESRFCQIYDTKYCVAVSNGLWALVMCLYCLKLAGRSEVVVPSLTYRRLADIAAWVNLTPNFCEVDPKTMSMTAATVEKVINQNTALILAVHPIVNICDIEGMLNVSEKHKLPLLFDSVEAAYASYNGKMIGGFGTAECFSMHASKFLNGFEAGYITTNDAELYKKLKAMRNHGRPDDGEISTLGLNAKLSELHAAMALASLDDMNDQIKRNFKKYKKYEELLNNITGIELIKYSETETRTYKNILIKLNDNWPLSRAQTIDILHKENMLVRPYYSPPLHMKKTTYKTIYENLSLSEKLSENHILMPCGDFLEMDEIETISELLKFLQNNGNDIKKKLS